MVLRSQRWFLALPLVLVLFGAYSIPASAAGPMTLDTFKSCVQQLQGSHPHLLTLAEAQACAPTLPTLTSSDASTLAAQGQLPGEFIVIRSQGAALEWTGTTPATSSMLVASSCYNTWTYPDPGWFDVLDWGNLSMAGYGNHCNYANIPNTPSWGWQCVGCTGTSHSQGHADSTWDYNNYGINSALGWGNITFFFPYSEDQWSCRGWVSTSGTQSPSPWCQ